MNRPFNHKAGSSAPAGASAISPVDAPTPSLGATANASVPRPLGSGAPTAEPIPYDSGTGPRCISCKRNISMCFCHSDDEPQAEYFRPASNFDPDRGWALAERSAFGMDR